ncbi:MAG TPA: hypothetical protein VLJ19_18710 [Variovorax sp.]|nr:hypothetical protein [Variovorax sp.]
MKVPDGVLNVTTINHTVYPGTIRRTVIEFEGGLYLYTNGAGVNRYYNSGQGQIPSRPALSLVRDAAHIGFAVGNDTFGPQAFGAVDQQAVAYLNSVRAGAA